MRSTALSTNHLALASANLQHFVVMRSFPLRLRPPPKEETMPARIDRRPADAAAPAPPSRPRSLARGQARRGARGVRAGEDRVGALPRGAATGEFDTARAPGWRTPSAACWRTVSRPACPTSRRCRTRPSTRWRPPVASTPRRAYIVYRDRHARLRADRKTLVDVAASVDEYLEQKDWRVNANANQGYSLGGLILNVSGKVVANYGCRTSTRRRSAARAPRRRRPHPRPRHARRLLRGWFAARAAARGPQRRAGKSRPALPSTCRARSARR